MKNFTYLLSIGLMTGALLTGCGSSSSSDDITPTTAPSTEASATPSTEASATPSSEASTAPSTEASTAPSSEASTAPTGTGCPNALPC